jgi:hypothetical protein
MLVNISVAAASREALCIKVGVAASRSLCGAGGRGVAQLVGPASGKPLCVANDFTIRKVANGVEARVLTRNLLVSAAETAASTVKGLRRRLFYFRCAMAHFARLAVSSQLSHFFARCADSNRKYARNKS